MPKRYEIKFRETWVTCKRAVEVGKNGFLHYELYDTTTGLARQGTWREKGKQAGPLVPVTTPPILDDILEYDPRLTSTYTSRDGDDDILDI